MKLQVVSYHSGIPKINRSQEKFDILFNYIAGVNAKGDTGINHTGFNLIDCDVAVMQGFVHEFSRNLPHLNLRKNILQNQKLKGKRTLITDSNLFLYHIPSNQPHHYLRYSFDGVFRKTGFYFDKDVNPKRWQSIKTNLGLQEKPYRTSGDHILICLQRNGGWSMKNYDVMQFCHDTISRLRQYTDRPIVVRGHPGDKKSQFYIKLNLPNVRISQPGTTIQQDLANAWATVIYNSSPGVASLIEGVPVFQMDADPDYSMYSEVANFFLENIENPTLHDRQDWLEKISMSHWNFAELKSGEAWDFMRNYV
tara:strand:- start:180 stop:1106 length:927 start_codon:yes stop_codon:yes gene_type:complete